MQKLRTEGRKTKNQQLLKDDKALKRKLPSKNVESSGDSVELPTA